MNAELLQICTELVEYYTDDAQHLYNIFMADARGQLGVALHNAQEDLHCQRIFGNDPALLK